MAPGGGEWARRCHCAVEPPASTGFLLRPQVAAASSSSITPASAAFVLQPTCLHAGESICRGEREGGGVVEHARGWGGLGAPVSSCSRTSCLDRVRTTSRAAAVSSCSIAPASTAFVLQPVKGGRVQFIVHCSRTGTYRNRRGVVERPREGKDGHAARAAEPRCADR
jgi:hypothetical protein